MALPLPSLDDRTFDQLFDELRERLPATAPAWTDHNESDPGVTMLELFAYLGEALLYRFDRIPERQVRAFLRLVGCAPRPARVARAVVALRAVAAAGAVDLPAGIQIAGAGGAPFVFQTGTPFHVTGARLDAVVTVAGGRVHDRGVSGPGLGAPFAALGDDPRPGDALYLGFDQPLGDGDELVSLFVFGEDPAADLLTWQALRAEWRRGATLPASCARVSRSAAGFWRHYGARVTWEYRADHEWKALPALKDGTRALSLSGPVRWRAPARDAHAPGGIVGHDATYFVRCRMVDGEYDCAPRLRGARINAVVARHAADVARPSALGTSTGRAHQRFRFPERPVVPGSTRLDVAGGGGPSLEWIERPDFDRSGPHARDYVLDAARGDLSFGDGRGARVPAAGATVTARWKVGGGALGNVPAGTLAALPTAGANAGVPGWTAVAAALAVEQPSAACGGADAESLDAAKARAFRVVADERCAVTLADLERAALAVPGVPVARARAVPELHPDLGCLPVAGCVTLVVVPRCVERRREPSESMCRAVARFVSSRRPVALEVRVAGPRYTVVTVSARLAVARGLDRVAVLARANAALRALLHPLSGGSEGAGWPIGRAVYRSEILALLDGLEGVDHVTDLSLAADDGSPASCGDVVLCPDGLPVSGQHRLSAA